MRKIMMIAALVSSAYCFAGEPAAINEAPVQRRAGVPPIEIKDAFLTQGCFIDVIAVIPALGDSEIRLRADERDARGYFEIVSEGRHVARRGGFFGKFAYVGDFGVLIEVTDGHGNGALMILEKTNVHSGTGGLQPASSAMPTSGHALEKFDRSIRTYDLTLEGLQMRFASARSGEAFLARLSDRMAPRDARVNPADRCEGNFCDEDEVVQVVPGRGRAGVYRGGGINLGPVAPGPWR